MYNKGTGSHPTGPIPWLLPLRHHTRIKTLDQNLIVIHEAFLVGLNGSRVHMIKYWLAHDLNETWSPDRTAKGRTKAIDFQYKAMKNWTRKGFPLTVMSCASKTCSQGLDVCVEFSREPQRNKMEVLLFLSFPEQCQATATKWVRSSGNWCF